MTLLFQKLWYFPSPARALEFLTGSRYLKEQKSDPTVLECPEVWNCGTVRSLTQFIQTCCCSDTVTSSKREPADASTSIKISETSYLWRFQTRSDSTLSGLEHFQYLRLIRPQVFRLYDENKVPRKNPERDTRNSHREPRLALTWESNPKCFAVR